MNGNKAIAALRPRPTRDETYAVVSTGPVAGSPLFAFGYTSSKATADRAASHLFRNFGTLGESIEVVVAADVVVEPLPAERRAQIPALAS